MPEITKLEMLGDAAQPKPTAKHPRAVPYKPRQLPAHWRTSTATQTIRTQMPQPSKLDAGDPRQDRHVRRGRRDIDRTIDLHGLT